MTPFLSVHLSIIALCIAIIIQTLSLRALRHRIERLERTP